MTGETKKILKNLICAGIVALALAGGPREAKGTTLPVTTLYEFLPDQSTVVYYGGWGGPWSCSIEGQFQLTVDYDADFASFDRVDATLSEEIPYYDYDKDDVLLTQSLGVLFSMTELESTYVSDGQIDFLLERNIPMFPGADIYLDLTFIDDSVHLTGHFGMPWADGYWYNLDAVAVPEPVTLFLVGLGVLLLRRRN